MLAATIILACSAAYATAAAIQDSAAACSEKAYIIAARGSIVDPSQCNDPNHLGNLGLITQPVQSQAGGNVTVMPVVYPASTGSGCQPDYKTSRTQGEAAMRMLIENRVNSCGNNSNIVLIGYSQGAQVTTDLLSGGSDTGTVALADKYVKQLKAVVLIANPAQKPGAVYNNNATAPDGSLPAPDGPAKPTQPTFVIPNPKKVASLGKRVIAYCEKFDSFCDAPSSNPGTVHQQEVQTWSQPAIKFILRLI